MFKKIIINLLICSLFPCISLASLCKDSLQDDDILHALHTIESDHIDQSIALQNDIKSVVSTLQILTEKVEAMDSRLQTAGNSGIDKRLKTLEEKVDTLISLSTITTPPQEKIDKSPDCASFIETIIELTAKISSLEHKFENSVNTSTMIWSAFHHSLEQIKPL